MIACCGRSHGMGLQVEVGYKPFSLLCCQNTAIICVSHTAPLLFSPLQSHLLYVGTEAVWQGQLRRRKAILALYLVC